MDKTQRSAKQISHTQRLGRVEYYRRLAKKLGVGPDGNPVQVGGGIFPFSERARSQLRRRKIYDQFHLATQKNSK
jgi:hypothetical protein